MNGEFTAGVRRAAMDLLARREHSFQELQEKLCRRFENCEEVRHVLEELTGENLQNDLRFAESFVRSRTQRGQGPLRIAAELRQRGVDESLLSAVLDPDDISWVNSARAAQEKRFGAAPAEDRQERARRMRFLERRGFSATQIRRALSAEVEHV